MKTKIRIQESSTQHGFEHKGYRHMFIQILVPRFANSRYLEPIGEITFQRNVAELENKWYAMNFVINTDNEKYIQKMATLAKFIKNNRSGFCAQPDEIISLIGGEEHVNFDGEFIPVSDKGKNTYKVMSEFGSFQERIIATNEILAQKIFKKRNIAGEKLVFDKKIIF